MAKRDRCRLAHHRAGQADPRHAFVESSNGRLRDACRGEEVFDGLAHTHRLLARWRHDHNHARPHSSLGGLTPMQARRSPEPLHGPDLAVLATRAVIGYQGAELPS